MHSAQAQMIYTQKAAGSSTASPTRTHSGFTFQLLTSTSSKTPSCTMPIELTEEPPIINKNML